MVYSKLFQEMAQRFRDADSADKLVSASARAMDLLKMAEQAGAFSWADFDTDFAYLPPSKKFIPDDHRGYAEWQSAALFLGRHAGITNANEYRTEAKGAGFGSTQRNWKELAGNYAIMCEWLGEKIASEREKPVEPDLRTISEIAKFLSLERKSIQTAKIKEWGEPVITASGRRPARYDFNQIRPILKQQYPNGFKEK